MVNGTASFGVAVHGYRPAPLTSASSIRALVVLDELASLGLLPKALPVKTLDNKPAATEALTPVPALAGLAPPSALPASTRYSMTLDPNAWKSK